MIESEQELLEQIRLRNKVVYEAFYKKHYKAFYSLAYNYVRWHETAEEIVHDVFVNIWNKADKINISQSLKSYVAKSVVNTALNHLKKEKTDSQKHEKYSEWSIGDLTPESDVADKELLFVKLEKALELLPPQCKKVMMMSRFEKLKQQEIADQLNISIKTVKNHLTFGFAKIRTILIAEGVELVLVIMLSVLTSKI